MQGSSYGEHEAADGFIEQEKEENLSIQEQKIQLFANDVVIRQVAKQIQQERLRLKKEQQAKKARYIRLMKKVKG